TTTAKSHKARDEHADLRKILELHIGVDCHICHSSPVDLRSTSARINLHAEYGPKNELRQLLNKVLEKDRKQVAKTVTVSTVMKEIEIAMRKQAEAIGDKETEVAALEEIEESVKQMKEKLRRGGGKCYCCCGAHLIMNDPPCQTAGF